MSFRAQNGAVDTHNGVVEAKKFRPGLQTSGRRFKSLWWGAGSGSGSAFSAKLDPDPHLVQSWIRIRISVKMCIRIRIKVMRIYKLGNGITCQWCSRAWILPDPDLPYSDQSMFTRVTPCTGIFFFFSVSEVDSLFQTQFEHLSGC